MDFILERFRQALTLIVSLDQEVLGIAFLSLWISTAATIFASLIGVPLGFAIGATQFPGKYMTITFFNTLLSFPTVVVGLLVFAFISRQGPFVFFGYSLFANRDDYWPVYPGYSHNYRAYYCSRAGG